RINVFPVPDGDTGTNFASTLRAVATAVVRVPDRALRVVTRIMADACIVAARGNSGLLFSQFLIGIREGLGSLNRATATELATAIQCGADRLRSALDQPVEGTILTVARDAADEAVRAAGDTTNLAALIRRVFDRAERSLEGTPDLLPVLREAGVVDAGGKAL